MNCGEKKLYTPQQVIIQQVQTSKIASDQAAHIAMLGSQTW